LTFWWFEEGAITTQFLAPNGRFSLFRPKLLPEVVFGVGKLHCMNNDKYPQFTVRLSDKSVQQLERLALNRSRSRSEIVREAISYYSRLYSLITVDTKE